MQIEPKKLNMDQEVDLVESDSEDLPAVPPSQPRDELDSVVGESGATRDEPDREEVPVSTPPLVPSTVLGAELADPTMSAERLAGLKRQLTEVTAAEKTKAKEPGSKKPRKTAAKGKAASKAKAKTKQADEKQEDEEENPLEPEEADSSEEQPSPDGNKEEKQEASLTYIYYKSFCQVVFHELT